MELFRALGTLAEPPAPEHAPLARLLDLGDPPAPAGYDDLFTFQLYPYASVYLGPEGMLGGEARDRIAGFWRALGQTPPSEPDHLAVLLAAYARLSDLESESPEPTRARWRHARRAFLGEHLLSWLPPYLDRVAELAPPFYRRWAELLTAALADEAAALAPPDLSLHLRTAPPLSDPRTDGAAPFLASLLAPARAGFLLVRSDLTRTAQDLNLGIRIGERRFVLQSLLDQDPHPTLAWLATEARRQATRHRALPSSFSPTLTHWSARATHSATLLSSLSTAAD